jgi:F-type H+-transporting ATPase subunit epsilon
MATFDLEVATPERPVVHERVTEAQIPAANGMLGVLPDHAALLSILGTGPLTFTGGEGRKTVFISGGWLQILNNHVRVLTERAEVASEIDTSRAEAAMKRALERLTQPATAGVDVARALNALRRAEARIAAAKAGHVPER